MKYSVKAISDNAKVSYENELVKAVFDKDSDNASFALKIDFSEWENDAYVFMPACAYDGNRFPRVKRKYPPMYTAEEMGIEPKPIITEVPALEPDGSGKIEVNIGDLSVPCVGVFYRNKKEALLVFTEQECKEKNVGFCVEKASVTVQYPVLRSTCYRMCRCDEPSTDSGFSVTAGEVVMSKLVIKTFSCESITEFFKVFFFSRKTLLSGSAAPNGYTKELWDVMEAHFNTENWSGEYYAEVTKKWQCGWVGGGMSTLALYKLGGEISKKRLSRN